MDKGTGISEQIHRLVTQPTAELSRARRASKFWADLSKHCAQQLRRNQATQMAAALTYRTIFSLLPIAVLMLLVFRAFGGFESMGSELQGQVYEYLGLTSISLSSGPEAGGGSAVEAQGDPAVGGDQLKAGVDKIMSDLTQKASEVSVGSIGIVGLVVLIWAAVAQLVTVEQCFNQIFNCPSGRAWHLRVPIYWAVITLGPVLLWVSLYVAGAMVGHVQLWADTGWLPGFVGWVLGLLSQGMALVASWLLLFLLYLLMPNTRVRVRSALAGAFVAAVLWELGKVGFKLYVKRAVSYSVLYGSLGLVPLFLLWLYLTWLVVLFGLEITYTLQAMRGRVFEKEAARNSQRAVYDGRWLVPVVTKIGQAFSRGQTVSTDELSQQLGLPSRAVEELSQRLIEAGMVHRVVGGGEEEGRLTLARRPEDIPVRQLLEVGEKMGVDRAARQDEPGWRFLEQLAKAQLETAGPTTVAQLVQGR